MQLSAFSESFFSSKKGFKSEKQKEPGGTLTCSLQAVGLQRHQRAVAGEVTAQYTQVSLKPPGKSTRKPLEREIHTCTPVQTIQPPPDLPSLRPLSMLQRAKNQNFFPQHLGISLPTGTWICLFCCTFSAIQSSTCPTFLLPPLKQPFALQSTPLGSLAYPDSKVLWITTTKSGSPCFLLPFTVDFSHPINSTCRY